MSSVEAARTGRRNPGLPQITMCHATWGALRVMLLVRHRLRIVGHSKLPKRPPFVVVANHCSHLDALVLGAALPWQVCSCAFPIAAGDVFFETRIASVMSATMLNALPMWRHNFGLHAMKDFRDRLVGDPCAFILFPEGGRSRTGEMGQFKPGLGMLVAGTDVSVYPARIAGAFEC